MNSLLRYIIDMCFSVAWIISQSNQSEECVWVQISSIRDKDLDIYTICEIYVISGCKLLCTIESTFDFEYEGESYIVADVATSKLFSLYVQGLHM